MDIKKFKENWRGAFRDRLEKNEKKQVGKFYRYFKNEYYKGIESYVNTNSEREFSNLFKIRDIENLYINLYEEVGVDFAKWYARSFDKFIQKNSGSESTWRTTFSRIGQTEAGDKIALVQGTALKELKRNIGTLFKDPEFQSLGRQQQGRILQNRFRGITEYQSQRIVRTEATSAANEGIMQSSQDIFPKSSLVKEWISSQDGRTRSLSRGDKSDHLNMNGKVVGFDETFAVPETFRVVQMRKPADFRSGASAHNIVNCRCSLAVYPKEGAQVREGVSLTGIGGGVSARTSQLIGDEIVTARKPDPVVPQRAAAEKAEISFKNRKEASDYFVNKLGGKYSNFDGVDLKIVESYINTYVKMKDKFKGLQLNSFSGIKGFRSDIVDEIFNEYTKSKTFQKQADRFGYELYSKRIKLTIKKNLRISKVNSDIVASYHHYKSNYKHPLFDVNINLSKYRGIIHKSKDNFERASSTGKSLEANKWWSKGASNPAHTPTHELGHAIDFEIEFHKEKEFMRLYEKYRSKGQDYREGKFLHNTYIRDELSKYGSINEKEVIAESVAEYFTSDSPRPMSIEVTEMLMRYWEKNKNRKMFKNKDIIDQEFPIIPFGGAHKPDSDYVELPDSANF